MIVLLFLESFHPRTFFLKIKNMSFDSKACFSYFFKIENRFKATYLLGPPKASGILSIAYLCCATYIIGTPGIFRIRFFKSLSFVATM